MPSPETIKFIHSVQTNSNLVTSTCRQILTGDLPSPPKDDLFEVYNMMRFSLNHRKIRETMPSWMDKTGIFSLTSELSSPSFWSALLATADPATISSVTQEQGSTEPAKRITLNNAKSMTATLSLGLLGAAVGPAIDKCVAPRETNPLHTTFASEIGRHYPLPATDVDMYMQRVLTLIPNPDIRKIDDEGTLLYYLTKHNVFTGNISGTRCPATYLTQLLVGEWGRQLHTNETYRNRFQATLIREV